MSNHELSRFPVILSAGVRASRITASFTRTLSILYAKQTWSHDYPANVAATFPLFHDPGKRLDRRCIAECDHLLDGTRFVC